MSYPYIRRSDGNITLIIDNEPHVIERTHPNYELISQAITDRNWDVVPDLVDIPKAVIAYTHGKIEVLDGEVLYKGEPVHNLVVERILAFMEQGLEFEPLVKFLERLLANPSKRSVDELYKFLEHRNMPIDDEGYFYAYKGVNRDYKDCHSNKFDNRPGAKHRMERNQVCDNADVACSHGFHVGSLAYATGFGEKTVIVRVDPADVVSIPRDSSEQKLRTCAYEVVGYYKGALNDTYVDEDEWDDNEE